MLLINKKIIDIDTDASVSHLTRCLSTYVSFCRLIRFRFETYSFRTFELFQAETVRKSKIAVKKTLTNMCSQYVINEYINWKLKAYYLFFVIVTYILLDVLMYSIAEYFYELCCILTSPQGESKYKQRVKILSDTIHQNV